MVERWKVKLSALTGEEERTAYAYLPVGYGESGRRYPVMYMFDGHNLFCDSEATYGKSWGLSDYLDYTRTPLIIAAVECNHKGHSRLSEYSPVDFFFHDGTPIKGQGKKYMDWLTGEFKPFIDENFLTLPDRENTAIGGSSMGGLMTIYALCKYGKYFSRGAALSPSLWMNGGSMSGGFLEKAEFKKPTALFTSYGSREFSNHSAQQKAFAEACSLFIKRGVNITARVVEGGTHSESSWQKQIPYFMNSLGFYPDGENQD